MDIGRIIQVIPCVHPLIAVYTPEPKDSDEYCFSWIYYLGLTEDGYVVPLDLMSGYFENADALPETERGSQGFGSTGK